MTNLSWKNRYIKDEVWIQPRRRRDRKGKYGSIRILNDRHHRGSGSGIVSMDVIVKYPKRMR